ncbi:MAG: OmpH family outer membrane protein [Pseudomonadota bacterium]
MSRASKSQLTRRSDIAPIRIFATLAALAFCVGFGGAAHAQQTPRLQVQSPILTIDSDRLFENSFFGQATIRDIEAMGAQLAAENRRIEEELEAEEQELTEQRPTLDPNEFRALADAFDEKVQEIRRTQDAKSRDLTAQLEQRRVMFFNAAAPVLEQLMRETGAAVIMERRSVFVSSRAIDITGAAIERINLVLTYEEPPEEPE